MKRTLKKIMGGFLAVGIVVSSFTGVLSYASTPEIGAIAALEAEAYTLEAMLNYAMQDEQLAKAEYEAIIEAFNVTKPYTNIIKSEETHIRLLTPLFTTYNVDLPVGDWSSLITLPATLNEANQIGVDAEINNIAMYEKFLVQELPDDVRTVFEKLKDASENHLAAFEKQVSSASRTSGGFRKNGK